ncbi:tyrosine-type recombinase/integrase [Tundrisphaera sp. TA3]|uniref:tyrosine-type recombinase/integrase n=1 Tax=Tundrisphaera sp. TA3 TaxID=3435775 RepID=UPI003EBFBEE8
MAWHELDKASGFYRIGFYFGGKKFLRSKTLKIRDIKQAEAKCGVVEQTIRYLDDGMLAVPEGVDPGEFILSGGKLTAKAVTITPVKELTLKEMFDLYGASVQSKERSTLDTERIHRKHLLRILGPETIVNRMVKKDVQAYIDKRAGETYERTGQRTTRQTIQKEIGTLSVIWNWARESRQEGEVKTAPPIQKLAFPKGNKKDPFRSWDECEREILLAGLAGRSTRTLTKLEKSTFGRIWESLFLSEAEILAVIDQVREMKAFPMFAFAAYTGARRSEMCRSEISDVNFDSGRIKIREKKRDTSVTVSYRFIPLHDDLRAIMIAWIAKHPGGRFLFTGQDDRPLTKIMASKRFRSSLNGSRWHVLHGWHVFRHSFASNLARQGVPQTHIDELMGHETEAMRERYRHLFPQDLEQSVGRLFSRGK